MYNFHLVRPETERSLNEKASIAYRAALEAYDRVSPDDVARNLANAAAMQPELVELQFKALDHCIDRAEINYGASATEFYDLSDTIVKRLLVNPLLRQEERERAQRIDSQINGRSATSDRSALPAARDAVLERDEARLKTGLELMLLIQSNRLSARGMRRIQIQGAGALPTGAEGKKEPEKFLIDPHAPLPGEVLPGLPGVVQAAAGGAGGRGGGPPGGFNPLAGGQGGNPFAQPPAGANPFGGGGDAPPADPFAGAPAQGGASPFTPSGGPPAAAPTPAPTPFPAGPAPGFE